MHIAHRHVPHECISFPPPKKKVIAKISRKREKNKFRYIGMHS